MAFSIMFGKHSPNFEGSFGEKRAQDNQFVVPAVGGPLQFANDSGEPTSSRLIAIVPCPATGPPTVR